MDKKIILIFFCWLAILSAVGLASTHLPVREGVRCAVRNQLPYYRWDSFWYTTIARKGYSFSTEENSSIAFFPLYPLVIRGVHEIGIGLHEDELSFWLNVAFSFLAALALFRLAKIDYPERTGRIVVTIFLFFPPAYFFLSGYPDILFVLLAILSFLFARKGEWWKAGIASALLAIAKPYGILMLPTLLFEYAWVNGKDIRVFFRRYEWLPLLSPLVSFGGFIAFNAVRFGDPLAFLSAQRTWGRSLANPVSALLSEAGRSLFGGNILSGTNAPYLTYLACFIFSVIAFVWSWKRIRSSYLLFSGLLLLSALLTGTLTSWGRYMLLGFPIFFGPAIWLAERKRLFTAYVLLSALILVTMASYFVRCYPFE
ncbi:MAG TPA: glycosyltransferase 87 family protein [Candidatus Fimivivens sp.]|nr:glycosyltransferase 87 family protein [Candidatus Fimivivens sp.]